MSLATHLAAVSVRMVSPDMAGSVTDRCGALRTNS